MLCIKSSVLRAGNYQDATSDGRWFTMGSYDTNRAQYVKIDANLVYARTGYDMIARRGEVGIILKNMKCST